MLISFNIQSITYSSALYIYLIQSTVYCFELESNAVQGRRESTQISSLTNVRRADNNATRHVTLIDHKNHSSTRDAAEPRTLSSTFSSSINATRSADKASISNITTRGLFGGSSSSSSSSRRHSTTNRPLHRQSFEEDYGREGDTRVPFWNIAHMINSIEQVLPVIEAGSNGIEVDVSFDKRGFPIESYHGFPCDCGRHCHYREDFVKMIRYLSSITYPYGNSNLQLVLFDLKLKGLDERQKEAAGSYLASILNENLYASHLSVGPNGGREESRMKAPSLQSSTSRNQHHATSTINSRDDLSSSHEWLHPLYDETTAHQPPPPPPPHYDHHQQPPAALPIKPPMRVIISINHVVDSVLVKSFMNFLRQNRLDFMSKYIGFDVGMNDNLTDISDMWDDLNGATFNVWQGDGLTNCANIVRGVERLKQAINYRNGQGHFRKVYYWTADVMYHIRSVLRLGVDAVLTNQPQRVNQVLDEQEFVGKYRLATPYDDPFAQYWIKPSTWKMSFPTLNEAVETVNNIKETSANFVKTIPDGVSAIVKKVQSTITSNLR